MKNEDYNRQRVSQKNQRVIETLTYDVPQNNNNNKYDKKRDGPPKLFGKQDENNK